MKHIHESKQYYVTVLEKSAPIQVLISQTAHNTWVDSSNVSTGLTEKQLYTTKGDYTNRIEA